MKYKFLIGRGKIEELIKKLPVSYYLGTKIEVGISENETSFIDLIERKIYISPNNFIDIELDHKPNEEELENLVRCALYHEVSHAMLTPLALLKKENAVFDKEVINVFEDERIEDMLKDYYYRTDFKKFVKLVNNYKEQEMPRTPKEMFYQVVRYREINNEILNWLADGIKNDNLPRAVYEKTLNIMWFDGNNRFDTSPTFIKKRIFDYLDYLLKEEYLKNKKVKYVERMNAFSTDLSQINRYKSEVHTFYSFIKFLFKSFTCKEEKQVKTEPSKVSVDKETSDEQVDPIHLNNTDFIESHEYNDNENGEMGGLGLSTNGKIDVLEQVKRQLVLRLGARDRKFYDNCNKIIKIYRTSNKLNGNMGSAYSGRLNTRLFLRDNNESYRWFLKKNGNSIKHGSKLLLNIFCDTSGSFYYNVDVVNDMLTELEKIEKENPNLFEFNLISVNYELTVLPKKARRIFSQGGTWLKKEWKKTIDKLQDNSKDIINIALFDGRIYWQETRQLVSLFNKNNFIIICDNTNKPAFKTYCKEARKIIYVDHSDYADLLKDNILKSLNSYVMGL